MPLKGGRRPLRETFSGISKTGPTGSTRLTSRSAVRPCLWKCHWPAYPFHHDTARIMTLYGMAETGRASRPHLVDGAGLFDCRRAGTKLYKRPNHFLVVLCQGDPVATVLFEDQVEIPGNVATLTAFRHWSLSESFPKRGRIDWVRLTPKAGGEADRFVELEGGPELVVEIVSDAALTARGCRSPVSDARHRSPGTGGLGDGLRRGEKIALAGREWRFEEPPPDAQAAPPG